MKATAIYLGEQDNILDNKIINTLEILLDFHADAKINSASDLYEEEFNERSIFFEISDISKEEIELIIESFEIEIENVQLTII